MISKTTMKMVYDTIREKIISGSFAPGQKLNVEYIAELFGASTTPIREAFRILENERLLVGIPRKGVFVAKVSLEDFKNIFGARQMIEYGALDAIEKKKINILRKIEDNLEKEYETNFLQRDENANIERIIANIGIFHQFLVVASENTWIIDFYKSIQSSLCRYMYMLYSSGKFMAKNPKDEHEIISEKIGQD